jgi:hypothetical protein
MTGPIIVGVAGTCAVGLGVGALRLILRPRDPAAAPPSDEVDFTNDPKVDSLFRELWRFVAVTAVGAAAQFIALMWQLSES